MKKIFTLIFIFVMTFATTANAVEEPSWVEQLRQCSPITSLTSSHSTWDEVIMVKFTYEQPLDHNNPDGEKISLRGVIYMPDNTDPSSCVNELYISGYELNFPDDAYLLSSDYFANCTQIARRYKGTFVELEHRYYKKSAPTEPWTKLEYLNAAEAAQDFHAIIQAMKKVLKGKWAMNGVSKGGLTTTFQHAYYPDDADIYMANCAPYFNSVDDNRIHKYSSENGLTPELRDLLKNDRRTIIKDDNAVKEFQKIYQKDHPQATDEECQRRFYTMILEQYNYAFRSMLRKNIAKTLHDNDSVMAEYMKKYNVTASFMNAVRATDYKLNAQDTWYNYFEYKYNKASKRNIAKKEAYSVPHYEITEDEWNSDAEVPYYYQSNRELGNYSYDFHNLFTDDTDKQLADSLQTFYAKNGGSYVNMLFPFLKGVEYDNGALLDFTFSKVKEASKPIIFLYGEDDCFTGAQIDDQYINGTTTKKYILSAQYHGVVINKDEAQKDEIWSFFDKYLDPNYTSIQTITYEAKPSQVRKMMQGNRLIIVSGNKKYTVAGQLMDQ